MDQGISREDGAGLFARRGGLRERLRELAAFHGLSFFFAIAVAPHAHLNSLDDLLSGGPSDSGIFVEQTSQMASEPGVWFRAACIVDDDPCLACFHDDLGAAEPVSSIQFTLAFSPVPHPVSPSSPAEPMPPTARRQARAPPTA